MYHMAPGWLSSHCTGLHKRMFVSKWSTIIYLWIWLCRRRQAIIILPRVLIGKNELSQHSTTSFQKFKASFCDISPLHVSLYASKELLKELRFGDTTQMTLICKNQAVLHIVSILVFHDRTKHSEINCHFIREKIISGDITTSSINSSDQLTYVFT